MPATETPPSEQRILELDEIGDRLERVLQTACADDVEIVWLEFRRREVSVRRSIACIPHDRSIMIRVLDRGRLGCHRTAGGSIEELELAVRYAVAQSRAREPLRGLPHLPTPGPELRPSEKLWDPKIATLSRSKARALLKDLSAKGERTRLSWGSARVAVFNSRGVRQRHRVTQMSLRVACGEGAGAGSASSAARTLDALGADSVFDRARGRHAPPGIGDLPDATAPMILSAECVADLCEILKRDAFSATSYQQGYSLLRRHLGDQVFDRNLNLRDDGTDPSGLPFPFDLEGTAKQPVDLISGGTARTPALDQRQAAVLGLPPTGHSITGNDAQAENLFLLPGPASNSDLMRAATGGTWIGSFATLECYEPCRMMFRARAKGVRRIEQDHLGTALPDLIWEDSLLRVLSSLIAIGDTTNVCSSPTLLGGTSAPALCVTGGGTLQSA